jgi:hypothetical protein
MLIEGNYQPGTLVLVFNSTLVMQQGQKGEVQWMGPYCAQKQNDHGSYELDELDGTPINAIFAANQIKKYHS